MAGVARYDAKIAKCYEVIHECFRSAYLQATDKSILVREHRFREFWTNANLENLMVGAGIHAAIAALKEITEFCMKREVPLDNNLPISSRHSVHEA